MKSNQNRGFLKMTYKQSTKKVKHGRVYKWFHDVRPIRIKKEDVWLDDVKYYYIHKEKDKNNKIKYVVYAHAETDYSAHPKIFVEKSFKDKDKAIHYRDVLNAYREGYGNCSCGSGYD